MESRSLYQHHSLRVNSTRTHAHSVGQPALRKSLYTAHWYQHTWGYRPFHIHTLWDIAIYWSLLVLELIESWLHCWLRYLVFHNWCATERQWLVFWGGGFFYGLVNSHSSLSVWLIWAQLSFFMQTTGCAICLCPCTSHVVMWVYWCISVCLCVCLCVYLWVIRSGLEQLAPTMSHSFQQLQSMQTLWIVIGDCRMFSKKEKKKRKCSHPKLNGSLFLSCSSCPPT